MYHLLLVRYGEISLKGRNRKMFEDILLGNIKTALQGILVHDIHKTFGRLYIETDHWQQAAERLQRVFGIVSPFTGAQGRTAYGSHQSCRCKGYGRCQRQDL